MISLPCIFRSILSFGGQPLFFGGAVYRLAFAPFMRVTDFLSDLVNNMHNYSSKIIIGDFNSDPQCNQADAEFIRNFVDENSLFSIPLGAYHRENVDSELDLCMVDSNDVVREFQNSEAPFSDGHDMLHHLWLHHHLEISPIRTFKQ